MTVSVHDPFWVQNLLVEIFYIRFFLCLLFFYREVKRQSRKLFWQIQFILLSGKVWFGLSSRSNCFLQIIWFCCLVSVACSLFKMGEPVFNSESMNVVEKYFTQYALHDQDILGQKESVEKVLALVPDDILLHHLILDEEGTNRKKKIHFLLSDAILLTQP